MHSKNLHIDDSYLKENTAKVVARKSDEYGNWFAVDRTCFYAMSGGQPGDSGVVEKDGGTWSIVNTVAQEGITWHLLEDGSDLLENDEVMMRLDWTRRYAHMRMHSALHMLCAAVPAGVTSGSISAEKGRLDFDLSESIDKEQLTLKINEIIDGHHNMHTEWLSEDAFKSELKANKGLVRTVNAMPPINDERGVRLVIFGEVDRQPCGGTHVANTSEIGRVRIGKVEKKGKNNRRINIHFDV